MNNDVIGDRSVRRDYPIEGQSNKAIEVYMSHMKRGGGAEYYVSARPVEISPMFRTLELLGPHERNVRFPADTRFNKSKLLTAWQNFVASDECRRMVEEVKISLTTKRT